MRALGGVAVAIAAALAVLVPAPVRAQTDLETWAVSQPGVFGHVVASRFERIRDDSPTRIALTAIMDTLVAGACTLTTAEKASLGLTTPASVTAASRYLIKDDRRDANETAIFTASHLEKYGCTHPSTRLLMVNLFKLLKHRSAGTPLSSVRRPAALMHERRHEPVTNAPVWSEYLVKMDSQGFDSRPTRAALQKLTGFSAVRCEYGVDALDRSDQEMTAIDFWLERSPVGTRLQLPSVAGVTPSPLFTAFGISACPKTLAEARAVTTKAMKRLVAGPPAPKRNNATDTGSQSWSGIAERPYWKVPFLIDIVETDGTLSANATGGPPTGPIAVNFKFAGRAWQIPAPDGSRMSITGTLMPDGQIEATLTVADWSPPTAPITLRRVR